MKNQWLAYVIVAVVAIGAGVAIAGLPSSETVDGTITVPATTEATTTVPPATTEPAPAPTSTEVTETTEPPAESTTTTTAATTTVPEDLPDRADVAVVVANGADVGGLATRTADELRDLGYENVFPTDGEESTAETVIYFDEGFEGAAERIAEDLGIDPGIDTIQPIIVAPPIADDVEPIDLLVYLGQDRADA